jgi:peptide/nickel transport system permease protein
MVVVALAAPLVAPEDPLAMAPRERFQGPSRAHPCGTDEFGRDVCSRLIYGARISLEVGVISVGIALMAMLGSNIRNVMIAIGVVNTPIFMRVARASTLSVRAHQYVEAAESAGAGDVRVLTRHVLPNIAAPLIVQATLAFAWAIINEAALSFLGLGTQPPTPSWGIMVSKGREFMDHSPSAVVFSGTAIILAVLSLNILGDGLRDALDPHQAHR